MPDTGPAHPHRSDPFEPHEIQARLDAERARQQGIETDEDEIADEDIDEHLDVEDLTGGDR